METPSSTRRVTRSQTLASLTNNIPSSTLEKGLSNSRSTRKGKQQQQQQQERSALFDITNDSPIVGVATMGSLETPSSAMAKNRSCMVKRTPGSGEALLRGQVKTLLQRVEEEAELSKLSLESRRTFVHDLKGFVSSPVVLLAPTPANTPQISNLSDPNGNGNGLFSEAPSPLVEETLISQVIEESQKEQEESLELQKSIITRSLLLDFSEKFDSCDSSESESPFVESETKEKATPDDDNDSIWSVQVNTSTLGDDEMETEAEEEEEEHYDEAEQEGNDDFVDELCDGISKISMNGLPKFEGKHTRFVYDSDDEVECCDSPSILRLNGLPTPKGKHLRFLDE